MGNSKAPDYSTCSSTLQKIIWGMVGAPDLKVNFNMLWAMTYLLPFEEVEDGRRRSCLRVKLVRCEGRALNDSAKVAGARSSQGTDLSRALP